MKSTFSLILLFLSALCSPLRAQDAFPNTLTFDSLTDAQSPPAVLADVAWIAGHWRGEAFGGVTEEVWTPPLGNSMMCAFKLVVNGEVRFYELVTITEASGSLMLRLKHFHGDLKGWEEKEVTVDFPLVKLSPDRAYFDGFTFERVNEREMNVYVILEGAEGKHEQKFSYRKVITDSTDYADFER